VGFDEMVTFPPIDDAQISVGLVNALPCLHPAQMSAPGLVVPFHSRGRAVVNITWVSNMAALEDSKASIRT
jgi:hypothetical protein